MTYRKIYISILLLILSAAAHSQAWMKDLPEKKSFKQSGRFYQVQEAFDKYWEDKEIQKGKGWKQFKRWENFMEPRVYPYGYMSLPSINPVLKSFREEGSLPADWLSLGPEI